MCSNQEPDLTTAPELTAVLRELADREPIFHRAECGTTRAEFERLTSENFWETGASGQRYSRAFVLDVLERRLSHPRATICQHADEGWKILYHQGTLVA
jgi:hypothetical protein